MATLESEIAAPQTLQMLLLNESETRSRQRLHLPLSFELAQKRLCALLKYWLFCTHINELSNIWDKLEHAGWKRAHCHSRCVPRGRDQIFVCRCRKEARAKVLICSMNQFLCLQTVETCLWAKIFFSPTVTTLNYCAEADRQWEAQRCCCVVEILLTIKSWTLARRCLFSVLYYVAAGY
jgi:hypothetical protein